MKVHVEETGATRRVLKIQVPGEEVARELAAAYEALRKRTRIPGFRKGKAPRAILERQFGPSVEAEVMQRLIPDAYLRAVREAGVHPVDDPVIEDVHLDKKEHGLRFTATVEVQPPVEPPRYEGLVVEGEEVEVTEEDVARTLETLREANAQLVAVEDRPVARGDWVLVDYQARMDGKPLPELAGKDAWVEVGAGRLLPGFDEQLIGAKAGENRDVALTLPEDYVREDLAGKPVVFQVHVKEIKVRVLPELDDEFARDLGEYENLEALRQKVRERLAVEKAKAAEKRVKARLLQQLVDSHPMEVPEALVERRLRTLVERTREDMILSGRDPKAMALDEAYLREKLAPVARSQVKGYLLLQAIADKEGIQVTDADVEQALKDIARETRQSPETVRQLYLQREGSLESLRRMIREEKALDRVYEKAEVKKPSRIITTP